MSDTITLIQRSQQGDRDASERLVTENTGLIWSIARRYFGRGVEPDDLFQLGCVGFLKDCRSHDNFDRPHQVELHVTVAVRTF